MKYFLVLAEELHFWNTSEIVGLSQSALSRQIKSLEDELGVELFERDKRNVKLTSAGRFLYSQWKVLFDDLERTRLHAQKINRGISGTVRLSYPGSISYHFLPELLNSIHQKMPDLKFRLSEPTDEEQESLLLNFKVDLALSRDKFTHPTIESLPLFSEPACLVFPKFHFLANQEGIDYQLLKKERFILSPLDQSTFYSTFLRNWFEKQNFEPHLLIETDFGSLVLHLVSQGVGISILPQSFQYANKEELVFRPLQEEINLFLNWRKSDNNKAVQNVVLVAKEIGNKFQQSKVSDF